MKVRQDENPFSMLEVTLSEAFTIWRVRVIWSARSKRLIWNVREWRMDADLKASTVLEGEELRLRGDRDQV